MEESKASYYMVIPASVWNADIRDKAKLCYGIISVLANQSGYCYATNKYIGKQLGVSEVSISQYVAELTKLGVITSKIILKEDSKEVKERRIYLNDSLTGIKDNFNGPIKESFNTPIKDNFKGNTTSNNNTSNNTNSKWDKVYDKLIDGYPKNRIQSKNPVIKLLKNLSKEEIKLVLENKQRYLKASNGYVKNLRKYIEEECWSEEWLKLQESTNKTNKGGITDSFSKHDSLSDFE